MLSPVWPVFRKVAVLVTLSLVLFSGLPLARGDFLQYESGWTLADCDIFGSCGPAAADGVFAYINVKTETVNPGETIAQWIGYDVWRMGSHTWIQVGVALGQLPSSNGIGNGPFTNTPVFYAEVQHPSSYSFYSLGPASFGIDELFQLFILNNYWNVYINGVLQNPPGLIYQDLGVVGQVSAILEVHEPIGNVPNPSANGHWSSLNFWYANTWYPFGSTDGFYPLPNHTFGAVVAECGGYLVQQGSSTDFTVAGQNLLGCRGGAAITTRLQSITLIGPQSDHPAGQGTMSQSGGAPRLPTTYSPWAVLILVGLPLAIFTGLFFAVRRFRKRRKFGLFPSGVPSTID